MRRWFFILLAVLLAGFLPVNAQAHTWAGGSGYDAGRLWENVVVVDGITMDTYQGFKQVPASLHKYAYCEQDPVNLTDPSGRASTLAAQNGTAVHQYIGDDFIRQGIPLTRFSGPSVVNILQKVPGFTLPPSLQGVVTALFPDLTDIVTKEVYEIKPDNVRSIALGEAQLWAYIDLFNYLDPTGNWHPGTTYRPPLIVPINALNQATAVGAPITPPGMILYHVISVQQILKRQAVRAGVAENAELEDQVGIASLDSVLGGF